MVTSSTLTLSEKSMFSFFICRTPSLLKQAFDSFSSISAEVIGAGELFRDLLADLEQYERKSNLEAWAAIANSARNRILSISGGRES